MEFELKAGLSRAEALSVESRLAGRAGQGTRRLIVTRYFDTADRALAAMGAAVRIRQEGDRRQLTVKLAWPAVGGYREAREITRSWTRTRPDLAAIPDAAVRAALQAAAGEAPLMPWFSTRVQRSIWRLTEPMGEIEVAIDRGQIRAGRRAVPLCEIELELLGGSPEALFGLAEELLGATSAWLALPGKAERGARLAVGESLAPRLAEGRPPADAGLNVATGFRNLLEWLAVQIATALHLTLTSDEETGPHQLRVALRRLRAAVRVFRPALRKPVARALLRDARDIGRIVSPLRDADVLLPLFLDASRRTGDPAAADKLAVDLDRLHRALRADVRHQLKAACATGFGVRLLALAALGGWQEAGTASLRMGDFARAGLDRQWRRIRPLGDSLAILDSEARHELRKRLKIYRYGYELSGLAQKKDPCLNALKKLQVDLGHLNDADILAGWSPPGADPALRARLTAVRHELIGSRGLQARDLSMGRAVRHWAELRALATPRAMAEHRRPAARVEPNR